MATVLIVEDEDSLRETLSRYLTHEGHDVITAASGYEAFEAGIGAWPDVLIADWMLKNHIHGLHVSEVFRALHPNLSTILITGFPSTDLLEESDRVGVLRLLEKPFDLQELQKAVHVAVADTNADPSSDAAPIAALAIGIDGEIRFASDGTRTMLDAMSGTDGSAPVPNHVQDLIVGDALDLVSQAESDWVEVRVGTHERGPGQQTWLMRSRVRPDLAGWLVVVCLREEEQRRTDPRVQILLDERRASPSMQLEDRGPVVVIERDGVVRRLLVSQIERIGAICYPSDDLQSALRLLSAEPRAGTILVDCGLAGEEMRDWVAQIRSVRPDATIVGTGAIGAESDLYAQGIEKILRKPWRIQDLLDSIDS